MVNGNVLERGKRDKLGHRGTKGLAGPKPAPPGCPPAMGGLLLGSGGSQGACRPRGAAALGSQPRRLPSSALAPWPWPGDGGDRDRPSLHPN